jgi:SAM-dependent methyltransferase
MPKLTISLTISALLEPWHFMLFSLLHIPLTLRLHFRSLLRSPSSFLPLWFATFWSTVGPEVRNASAPRVQVLLAGKVTNGQESPTEVHPPIGGVVLEVGAGSGMWADVLASAPGVTRVLGVEPNLESAAALRRKVEESGVGNVYEVVPVGIEELAGDETGRLRVAEGEEKKAMARGHVEEESVDCIVSVLSLCSIPDPERNIAALYRLLRPGGRWYVYEHVRVNEEKAGRAMGMYQGASPFTIYSSGPSHPSHLQSAFPRVLPLSSLTALPAPNNRGE